MRLHLATLLLCAASLAADAAEPKRQRRTRTVPGPYPAIIRFPRVAEAPDRPATTVLLFDTDLGGRELLFLQTAHETGLRQLALATLAKAKAHSDHILGVAAALVDAQTAENKQVIRLASLKGLSLTTPGDPPSARELASLSGLKFDKMWIEQLLAINERAATAYEAGAQSVDDEIKSFAEAMLPLVKAKLKVAARLAGRSPAASTASP